MIIESDECMYRLYTREKNHTELFRCFKDRPRCHVGTTLLTKKHLKYRNTHDVLYYLNIRNFLESISVFQGG
ncbi:hypothetical protein ANTQUA_LOCUS2555 [Anthophora quadrimaculata]